MAKKKAIPIGQGSGAQRFRISLDLYNWKVHGNNFTVEVLLDEEKLQYLMERAAAQGGRSAELCEGGIVLQVIQIKGLGERPDPEPELVEPAQGLSLIEQARARLRQKAKVIG